MSAAKGLLEGDFAEITSRIARANYGFIYETKFVEGRHDEQDKYYSFVERCNKARNQIWWFLKKGEKSSQSEPFRVDYTRVYERHDHFDYPDLSGEIWTYPGNDPPSRVQDGVTQLCEMNFTAPVPFDDLPEEDNCQGTPIKVFEYAYEITCYGDSVDVGIFASGQKLTGQNLEIDFERNARQGTVRADSRLGQAPGYFNSNAASSSTSNTGTTAGPSTSTARATNAAAELPTTPESDAGLYDDEPVEPPPPSYTPYSDNPFADPVTSPSIVSTATVAVAAPVPVPPPLPPPGSLASNISPTREYLPYRPPGTQAPPSLRQPPPPPAFSSLTPNLAATATPLVNLVPLPPHRLRPVNTADNSASTTLPLRPAGTGSSNPFSAEYRPPGQFSVGPPPTPPGAGPSGTPTQASAAASAAASLAWGSRNADPPASPRAVETSSPDSDGFVVLNRRPSMGSIRTTGSKRRMRPLSSFLRRRRDDDSDTD